MNFIDRLDAIDAIPNLSPDLVYVLRQLEAEVSVYEAKLRQVPTSLRTCAHEDYKCMLYAFGVALESAREEGGG